MLNLIITHQSTIFPPPKKIPGIRITFTNKFHKSPSEPSFSAVGIGITWRAQWPTPWPRQICTGNPRISSGSKPLNMVLDLITEKRPYLPGRTRPKNWDEVTCWEPKHNLRWKIFPKCEWVKHTQHEWCLWNVQIFLFGWEVRLNCRCYGLQVCGFPRFEYGEQNQTTILLGGSKPLLHVSWFKHHLEQASARCVSCNKNIE